MNLETKIAIYKFTPQVFTLTRCSGKDGMSGQRNNLRNFIFKHISVPLKWDELNN